MIDLTTVEGWCQTCGRGAPFRYGKCVICRFGQSRTCTTPGCDARLQPGERCYKCSRCPVHGSHKAGERCPTWASATKAKDWTFGLIAAIFVVIILILFFGFFITSGFFGYGAFKAFEVLIFEWLRQEGAVTEAFIWFFWMIALGIGGAALFLFVTAVASAFGKIAKN